MADNILAITNLTKRFGAQTVIQNFSLTVRRGSRVAICAPSSAGKTTLINILAGLDPDYEGTFTLSAAKRATIFQEPRLFPYMTVEENIFLPARLQGASQRDQKRALARNAAPMDRPAGYQRWLEVCGLESYTRHYPHQLSGGMKQKVALIRGFLTEPDFMMMDEPFKSIDVRSKQAIIRHILDNYPHVTILFVTHAMDEIPLLTQSLLLFKTNQLADFVVYQAHDVVQPGPDLMEEIYG